MASRLPHQRSANMIILLLHRAPPRQNGFARQCWHTVDDDAQGLTGSVGVERGNDWHVFVGCKVVPVQLHIVMAPFFPYASICCAGLPYCKASTPARTKRQPAICQP